MDKTIRRAATLARAVTTVKNWPTYLADYAGWMSGDRMVYRLRNGLRYELRPGTADRGILTEVWLRDDYRFALDSLGREDAIVDLGAQVGLVSTFIAFQTGARVYAYEPCAANFDLLTRNVAMNRLGSQVRPFNLAVSDVAGEIPLYLSDTNTGGHSAVRIGARVANVKCVTLEDVLDSNGISTCALLKVDVEGSEYRIFYGCSQAVLNRIRRIIVEFHDFADVPLHNHADLASFLNHAGFEVIRRKSYLYCTSKIGCN